MGVIKDKYQKNTFRRTCAQVRHAAERTFMPALPAPPSFLERFNFAKGETRGGDTAPPGPKCAEKNAFQAENTLKSFPIRNIFYSNKSISIHISNHVFEYNSIIYENSKKLNSMSSHSTLSKTREGFMHTCSQNTINTGIIRYDLGVAVPG